MLRRAALLGATLLVASLVLGGVTSGLAQRARGARLAERDAHVAALTKDYQAYLDETAKRITGLPVDPKVVGEIQTRHFQERPGRSVYVWAADNKGGFQFGVPGDAFARLNTAFDQYQAVITRDNHFASRDQFLRTFLHEDRRLGAPSDEPGAGKPGDGRQPRSDRDPDGDWWRFYHEGDWRSNVMHLSSPIQDAAGATVGNLNLKLVDDRDQRLYSGWDDSGWRNVTELSHAGTILSLVWLWFMLPSWVYIDAQQRGVPRPLLWALLTLIGSVFALMVYLISRPADVAELRCPHCAKPLNGTRAGCPYCGADLSASFCPRCQYPVKPDWSFCPSCRGALARTPAPTEAVAP